jgi:type I restriction enzyme, S subunit
MSKGLLTTFSAAKWLRIGDVAKTAGGSTPSRSRKDYWAPKPVSGVPWVKTAEIAFEPIFKTSEAVTETAMRECSLPVGPPGTVLIAMFGEGKTRGQSAVLKIAATFNQACFAIFPNEAFDPDYLQLWLMKQYRELRRLAIGRGGSQANLNGAILEDLKAPWIPRELQREFVMAARERLSLASTAQRGVDVQESELRRLADSVIFASLRSVHVRPERLGDVLNEVCFGVGSEWKGLPVLGATRAGLAAAKERPGKRPERYKPVTIGTVFYNPMRILIGSIAFVDDDDEPGITSPDYVVLKGQLGVVDSRWFYYWLRSPLGERCIQSLARGAVRERMLFNRLAEGEIELPDYDTQVKASKALAQLKSMRAAIQKQIGELELMPQKLLARVFDS